MREKLEKGGIIPHNQTCFRKGMETVDKIYVLNYLANRVVIGEKRG